MDAFLYPPSTFNQSAMFGIQIWLCHSLDFFSGNRESILIESMKSWTARRSNQPVLKEISSQYSLECLMLKLQYFGHLMWRPNSLEKTSTLGKIEGRRKRGQERMRWLDGITNSIDMNWANSGKWWRTGKSGVLQFMASQSQIRLSYWI